MVATDNPTLRLRGREFKLEALRVVRKHGVTVAQAARDLGHSACSHGILRREVASRRFEARSPFAPPPCAVGILARPRRLEWSIRVFPLVPRSYGRQDIPMLDYFSILYTKQIVERSRPGGQISLRQHKYKVALSHETAGDEI
jgi:hypothetical protein